MANDNDIQGLKVTQTESETGTEERDERTTYLQNGRTVAVSREGTEDIVEIRASSGTVELRVRVTEAGPVLTLEGVKLELRSAESVDVRCKSFTVAAEEKLELTSAGEARVSAEKELTVESTADVRLIGKSIWLN